MGREALRYSLQSKPGITPKYVQVELVSPEEYDLACRFQSTPGLKGIASRDEGVCFVYGKTEIFMLERKVPGKVKGKPVQLKFLATEDDILNLMAGKKEADEGALEKTLSFVKVIKTIAQSANLPIVDAEGKYIS